jgi:NAD(P)-dependent dehydrogenase (short-subunit alcohol dehydrogenase family)
MSKKIFITGTSTGFGKLTAITLSKAGHTVIACVRVVYEVFLKYPVVYKVCSFHSP